MKEWEKNKTFLTAFRFAARGIGEGYVREANVRRQVWVFVVVVLAALLLRITSIEFAILILTSAVILGLELMNTALEEIEDVIWPEYREAIRRSKDISAGAVLVASLAAIVIGGIIFLPHIVKLLY